MTRPTALSALAALALLAATSSAQASRTGAGAGAGQQAGGGPDPQPLSARPGDVLDAADTRPDGTVRKLSGRMHTEGGDLAGRAVDFLRDYGSAFGVDADVELRPQSVPPRPIVPRPTSPASMQMRLDQTVYDHVLLDHGLVVSFDDEGSVRRAHGVVSRRSPTGPPLIDEEDAADLALAAAGWTRASLRTDPVVRRLARVRSGRIELLYRVEVIRGLMPWAIEISARDGSLLRLYRDSSHGDGQIIWDGETVGFPTGKGVANVYKGVKAARVAKESGSSLRQLGQGDIGGDLFPDGTLTGRFAQVLEADGLQIINGAHDYRFLDDSPAVIAGVIQEFQLFDHANTFHWLTQAGSWFADLAPFAGDRAVLAYVNYDDGGAGFINAFYSPLDLDGDGAGHDPGYFVFGEFTGITGDPMDDLSRDPSIAIHEYTHMVVDQDGHTFGDAPIDWPPRAVNEALADFAAASLLRDPQVGHSFMTHSSDDIGLPGQEALRDLRAELTLPDDLGDVLGADSGLPAEHSAGQIFGAALWRAKASGLKQAASQVVLGDLGEWPLSTAEVGYPTVDVGNAADAYAAYFYACFQAMADLAQGDGTDKTGQRQAAALLGAFMSHGIAGTTPSTVYTLDASEIGLAARLSGAFLGSIDEHVFELELAAGQRVKLMAKGAKGTSVDIALGDPGGGDAAPEDLTVAKPKKVNAKGTRASLPKVLVGTGGTYRVTVSHDGDGGAYRLLIKVK